MMAKSAQKKLNTLTLKEEKTILRMLELVITERDPKGAK